MNSTKFTKIMDRRLDKVRVTLCRKAEEYAHGDRLSNFNVMADMNHCLPETALKLLVSKHIVALFDFIDEMENGNDGDDGRHYKFFDEKIGDIMAYMVLLDAMIQDV